MTEPMHLAPPTPGAPPWRPGRAETVVELCPSHETIGRPGQLVDEIAALLVAAHSAEAAFGSLVIPLLRLTSAHTSPAEARSAAGQWLGLSSTRERVSRKAANVWGVAPVAEPSTDVASNRLAYTWQGVRPPTYPVVSVTGTWLIQAVDHDLPPGGLTVGARERRTSAIVAPLHDNGVPVGVSVEPIPFVEYPGSGRDDRFDFLLWTISRTLQGTPCPSHGHR